MPHEETKLHALGARLKDERLSRNETQSTFAARIGVSVPTLRRMEAGDPTSQIGHWAAALAILDRTDDLDSLLAPKDDLFSRFEKTKEPERKRVSRRAR